MNKYELMTVVNAGLSQEEKDTIYKEVTDTVVKSGGKVINSQVWLDKHKFTFIIKKCAFGTYHLMNFDALADSIAKIRQILKLNEKVLRFLILRLEK